jgi:hypothetical protein
MIRAITITTAAVLTAGGISVGAVAASPAAGTTAASRPHRPVVEHVPLSVHHVRVVRRDRTGVSMTKQHTLNRKQARRLARAFDAMKTEPRGTVHCDIAGGPVTTVTFRTSAHIWRVREAACTNIVVTRDGKRLPTLLSNHRWEKALAHDLEN